MPDQWTNLFQIRPSGHDNGLPLCDVALFQTAAIANSLANKPAISREALQLKAASRATSSRSQDGSGRSVRSSTREAYEALTWRNKFRQHPVCYHYQICCPLLTELQKSPGQQPSPCCTSCFTKETPKWREGPFGSHTLCNVCGLLFAKRQARHHSMLVQRELSGMAENY